MGHATKTDNGGKTSRTGLPGEISLALGLRDLSGQNRGDQMPGDVRNGRTVDTGQPGNQDRKAVTIYVLKTGQLGHVSQDRSAGTGQPGQVSGARLSRESSAGTAQPGQVSKDRSAGQISLNRSA
jgi:hypothetical protein